MLNRANLQQIYQTSSFIVIKTCLIVATDVEVFDPP